MQLPPLAHACRMYAKKAVIDHRLPVIGKDDLISMGWII
jgi:hypothetical protein